MNTAGIFQRRAKDRKNCLSILRRDREVPAAVLLLLLNAQLSYRQIAQVLWTSFSTTSRVKRQYRHGGLEAALGTKPTRPRIVPSRVTVVVRWVTELTPQDFALLGWRWTCGLLAWVLGLKFSLGVSAETVRPYMHQAGFVWRRRRPVLFTENRVDRLKSGSQAVPELSTTGKAKK